MKEKNNSSIDQILDLLLDALQERQAAREKTAASSPPPEPLTPTIPSQPEPATTKPNPVLTEHEQQLADRVRQQAAERTPDTPDTPVAPPPRRETIYLGRMLGRLALGLILLVLLVNIPINQHGTALARAMPDQAALVIRDGLLLKGSGAEIYVLENNQRRWITTLDAFDYYGYRWENVHEVDDEFLSRFEEGAPLHILVKCTTSPHVYAIEDGRKRWIKDVPTFETLGVPWNSIQFRTCSHLRNMPDGIPIPPDAGDPPQP